MLSSMFKLSVQAPSTDAGLRYLRTHKLSEVTKVVCYKTTPDRGGPVSVQFYFSNENVTITISGAFSLGYGGTGPSGLHTILCEIGFDSKEADKVFQCKTPGELVFEK